MILRKIHLKNDRNYKKENKKGCWQEKNKKRLKIQQKYGCSINSLK